MILRQLIGMTDKDQVEDRVKLCYRHYKVAWDEAERIENDLEASGEPLPKRLIGDAARYVYLGHKTPERIRAEVQAYYRRRESRFHESRVRAMV